MHMPKIIIGSLGFLGTIGCTCSVVSGTLALGEPRNFIGAVLVTFLGACAGTCCAYVAYLGKTK